METLMYWVVYPSFARTTTQIFKHCLSYECECKMSNQKTD